MMSREHEENTIASVARGERTESLPSPSSTPMFQREVEVLQCVFDRVDCFKDIIPSFNNPVKESIFFMNEHVPERLRREDRLNAIVSFEKRCVPKSDYRSSFPAHVGHHHVVKCVRCDRSFESCAMEYGRNRSDFVLKLYSVY